MKFEFGDRGGHVRLGPAGSLVIQDNDRDVTAINPSDFRAFFAAMHAAEDEIFPPGPLEIPDPLRHEDVYARVNAVYEQPFSASEARAALGRIAAAVGNVIAPGRVLS